MSGCDAVEKIVADRMAEPVAQEVSVLAGQLAQRFGDAALGVLFYGSCARTGNLDGLLDFYIVVDRYRTAYGSRGLAVVNRLLPPNVFYAQQEPPPRTLRAKYAVISLPQLRRLVRRGTLQSYFWARFAQPMHLVWYRNDRVAQRIGAVAAVAAHTLFHSVPAVPDPIARWQNALKTTYRAELRPEHDAAIAALVTADRDHFRRLGDALTDTTNHHDAATRPVRYPWWLRRAWGKSLNIVRVLKAYWTFDGGVDYLFWKIGRHAGLEIEVTDPMRRHPWRRALPVLWRLYRRGAFR